MTTLRALIAAGLVVGMFGWAVAKLPAPPPMDDKAKAAAEEKKAKGKTVTPQMGPTSTPAAASPPSNRPSAKAEKQGAHSPPATVR
jgi:hypothetical protein